METEGEGSMSKSKKGAKSAEKAGTGDAFERVSADEAPLVRIGGAGRKHRYASVIDAIPTMKKGERLRVKILDGDDCKSVIVSISQGVRRRELRTLKNGCTIRVRTGADGNPYVCCD
jgi:hypothetical protein